MAGEVFIYARASDNLAPAATLTQSVGGVQAAYPLSCLVDGTFGKPAKWDNTTGDVIFDHGSDVEIDLVAFGPHNLTAGLGGVKLQRNATNSWGAPSLDTTITIPAYRADGTSTNAWKDLTVVAGYGAYRYTRLYVSSANGAAIQIGEIWLVGTKRQLVRNYQWGFVTDTFAKGLEHRTELGVVKTFGLGVSSRVLRVSLRGEESDRADLETWYLDARGRRDPVLIIPDDLVNDAWFCRVPAVLSLTRQFTDVNDTELTFDEVVRGPAL